MQAYLTRVSRPVEIVASLDDSDTARQMRELLQEIASLSPLVSLVEATTAPSASPRSASPARTSRSASASRRSPATNSYLAGAGPAQVGGHPPKVSDEVLAQIRDLDGGTTS